MVEKSKKLWKEAKRFTFIEASIAVGLFLIPTVGFALSSTYIYKKRKGRKESKKEKEDA